MKTLLTGDCLSVMPTLMANSVDSIVSDPPYGLSFMGKQWDHGVPGEHFWREAMRVAKPGAHLLAFGGTRTFHRLAVAIEDAGWEIRDTIMWVYGSGFPKSLDVSKAIDASVLHGGSNSRRIKEANASRPGEGRVRNSTTNNGVMGDAILAPKMTRDEPATNAAREWSGWGTALKPAWEPIIVARKPLEGTVAANVLKWGTGAINVDGCRVGGEPSPSAAMRASGRVPSSCKPGEYGDTIQNRITPERWQEARSGEQLGRWPANLIHDGSQMVLELFPVTTSGGVAGNRTHPENGQNCYGKYAPINYPKETSRPGDTGSAARFFYVAKASKADRDEGCEGLPQKSGLVGNKWTDQDYRSGDEKPSVSRRNHHPTVKPTSLMRYLCRLVTPPGGTVLDPFMGSGSTGKAAVLEGFSFVGIEMQPEYVEIARCRINAATDRTPEPAPAIRQADML